MSVFLPLTETTPVLSILSSISMFGGVPDHKRDEIFRLLELGAFKKDECIFCKGDDPVYIYIVKSGRVDLRITDDGVLLDKKELYIGESFGEASLISMHKHTATAIAMEESEIIVLSRHALIRLQQQDIQLFAMLMMNIARELARRLHFTDDILLHYLHTREGNVARADDDGVTSCVTIS